VYQWVELLVLDIIINFVFDPLAIALILVTNRILELDGKKTPFEPNLVGVTECISYAWVMPQVMRKL
jgi:hypothetical protein